MIAAHRLSKKFGNFVAVDSVDFEIPRGRVVGFLGPNGAGKTTTIRMICGYLRPTSGRVLVDGIDVQRDPRRAQRRLGYLPETAPLYPEMRVEEYLALRASLFGIPRGRRREAVESVTARCWLTDVRRRLIGHLSKGYRQRVGLASALLHRPPLLILDEPTSGLDPAQIREVRNLIGELAGDHTVVLSTHNLAEVELTCDHIIMLARGRIRAAGAIDGLRSAAAGERRFIVESDCGAASKVLSALPEVRAVEDAPAEGAFRRLTVTAREGTGDLREPIAKALAGGTTRELRCEAPTLERLYVALLDDAEGEAPGPPAEGART